MADDYPTPPKDTLVSGTGSAVQIATDPRGDEWQFDNEKRNWVNLTTGEAVSPKLFSQMAGRSGNAARDTIALSQAMRREEAALIPPNRPRFAPTAATVPQAPPPSVAPVTPVPPSTMTASTQAAPVLAPGTEGVFPPYSAQDLVRVRNQRPVPSTRVPPSPGAERFYQMQQVDWLMRNRDMKPADAMRVVGIEPGLTTYQRAQQATQNANLEERKREFDARLASTAQKASATKIHFGPNGQVLSEKNGVVDQIRPPDPGSPKYRGVHTSLPAGKFGPEISGPADHPDIVARQKLMADDKARRESEAAAEASRPGLLRRGLNAITGAGKPAAAASPITTPAEKGEIVRMTKDGRKAVYDAKTKQFIRYLDDRPPEASFHF